MSQAFDEWKEELELRAAQYGPGLPNLLTLGALIVIALYLAVKK